MIEHTPAGEAVAATPPRVLQPGQLTDGWRWVFTLGWTLIVLAMMATADAAHSLGKPPWWMDRVGNVASWTPLIFVVPAVPTIAGFVNWRHWLLAGAFGVVVFGLSAWIDASRSPGIALAEATMALAGLATTLAALAGRVRAPLDTELTE